MEIHTNLQEFNAAVPHISDKPLGANVIRDAARMKQATHAVLTNLSVIRATSRTSGRIVDLFA